MSLHSITFEHLPPTSIYMSCCKERLTDLLHAPSLPDVIRNFAMAAAMFMNSNSLPIALLQSLVVTVPGLQWGDDDSVDAMVGRALTYLVICSTLGMVVSHFISLFFIPGTVYQTYLYVRLLP